MLNEKYIWLKSKFMWKQILLDPEDFHRVNLFTWSYSLGKKKYYNIQTRIDGKVTNLPHYILNLPSTIGIDHIDRDPFNNRKDNFRICTTQQNNWNRSPQFNKLGTKYKGVSYHVRRNKWQTRITKNGRTYHLGYFETDIEAAKAYNSAALAYFGEYAYLNPLYEKSKTLNDSNPKEKKEIN